jgi:23S rRNA pseudouridine1911/1915/1917 synthase
VKHHPIVIVSSREATLADVLPRLGEGADRALREGRVFVGARRASSAAERVAAGDEVVMYASRVRGSDAPRILLQRRGIVAAYKPADIATVADHRGRTGTLEDDIAKELALSPGELVATSRLDVGVSGVVLFATDEASRARLARARKHGRYRRHYIAISASRPVPERGVWTAPIGRDRDPRKRRAEGRDAVSATTAYAVRAATDTAALLAVEPETGRTHQIRVHTAHAGCALYGDAAYGGPTRLISDRGRVTAVDRIALHSAWVEVPDEDDAPFRFEAEAPADLVAIWIACGGPPSAWALARDPL